MLNIGFKKFDIYIKCFIKLIKKCLILNIFIFILYIENMESNNILKDKSYGIKM